MALSLVLVDPDPRMIDAWRRSFDNELEVSIVQGALTDQDVSAWVVPESTSLEPGLQRILEAEVARAHGGTLEAGHAVCVATGQAYPQFLIRTAAPESDPRSLALATAAAFFAAYRANAASHGAIRSLALPDLGGPPDPAVRADLTWTAYELLRSAQVPSFEALRIALDELFTMPIDPTKTGAYRRTFRGPSELAQTLPDSAAAQAQLRKRLDQLLQKARDEGRGE